MKSLSKAESLLINDFNMGYQIDFHVKPSKQTLNNEINFDENEDEIEIDENLQNLEKIYEDFLSFNQDYMNK